MEKATDEITLNAMRKMGNIVRVREQYVARCRDTRMILAGLVPAGWVKGRMANLNLETKVLARLEKSWIEAKKKIRAYENENGLAPVILDFGSRWYGYRNNTPEECADLSADAFDELCRRTGMKKGALAKICGKTPATFSRYCSGICPVPRLVWEKVKEFAK